MTEDRFSLADGTQFTVLERPDDGDGSLVLRFCVPPGTGVPPAHFHPGTSEVFEVEEGSFELLVGTEWRVLTPGERVVVPAGTPHTFRNRTGESVTVRNVFDPDRGFEAFFREMALLTHEVGDAGSLAPGPAIRTAMVWRRYPDSIRPARPLARLTYAALSATGRLVGLKPPGRSRAYA